ncbi:MAG TPA: CHAT domain-containing protein [Kofleriaceae bacterium]|nr:CHAT domain-containing protein [Kofleriaceae bacterium]
MTEVCETLHAYVDGELEAAELSAFETHLAGCDDCTAELPRLLALMSALEGAAAVSTAPAGGKRLVVINGGEGAIAAKVAAPRRSRRPVWIAAGGALAAAAVAVAVAVIPPGKPVPAPETVALRSELGPARLLQSRLSYPGTAEYRPVDVARGAERSEPISIESRARLEKAKDWHGLAVASLLAGERERAVQLFAQVAASPHADSDRAALELVDGSPPALERALDDVDRALAQLPGDPAALWNRALTLAALNLPLAAAREFDRVAALGESGWADEAKRRAQALRKAVSERRLRWRQTYDAGRKMIEGGAPVTPQALGTTTLMFYDAVRAAPSKERALGLLPLAQQLDSAYRTDRLSAYVQRVAASDFRVRKPLADAYRELALQRMPADAVEPFLKRLAKIPGVDDLRMGALVHARAIGAHLAEYQRLAAATHDPWFAAIAMGEAARAAIARGERVATEQNLREAIAFAKRERVGYRALALQDQLIEIHRWARQLSRVAAEIRDEFNDAIAAGEWIYEANGLVDLSSVNQSRYANGLARAYLTELLERSEPRAASGPVPFDEAYDCPTRQYAYQSLAIIALLRLDPRGARDYAAKAPECATDAALTSAMARPRALVATELYHLEHREEDARRARESIAAMRTKQDPSKGWLAMAMHLEGALAIETDRAAGRRMLRDAIATAGEQTDVFGIQARAYSYSLLALDAGAASEYAEVVRVLADAHGVSVPPTCALAIAVQGQRSVVAYVDPQGANGGQFAADRKTPEVDASTLVPPAIVEHLRGCERVSVLARAPVLGAGRLLPPDIAWSYMLGRSSAAAPRPTAPGKRLVVADPVAPPDLNLPRLGPLPEEAASPDVTILRGADATPTRVLMEMRDASVIELHTHGVIANDVSEASYLVLSPELDRQYAMTASDVEPTKLTASPLVLLGACHAATSSRSLEGGMGLAEAFLRAGARAVVASPDAVSDLGAHGFFAAVREQVMRGTDAAVAVRDERQRRPATSRNDSWIDGVVVFE